MVEASFKAFARALRAAVGARRPGRGRALDQGRPLSQPRIAILDYGMGNLRSVGKALEHVGAEPFLTLRPRARARGRRRRAARRGRDAEGDGARARAGARPAAARAGRGERAGDRAVHGDAASVRVHHRAGRGRGDRAAARARGGARRSRPQGAADRLESGELAAREPAHRGPAVAVRLLPRELVRAAAGGRRTPCSAPPSTGPSS